jgi:hypothetical protein
VLLAGVSVPDRLVVILAGSLRDAGLGGTAARLEDAREQGAELLALDLGERDDLMTVLADCPPGLGELRAVLLQQRAWRAREGIN